MSNVPTVSAQLKDAATAEIRQTIDRGFIAHENGDDTAAAQAFAQAVAVSAVYSLVTAYGLTVVYPLRGLSNALQNLSKSPTIATQVLLKSGLVSDPLVASRAATISKSFSGGAAAALMTSKAIDLFNQHGFGARLYDWTHPDELMNTSWRRAREPARRDPLSVDLDGDGIETVGLPPSGAPILFDHDADGVRTGTGWIKADDAWLVLDRDGNGSIDSGRELFGVDTLIQERRAYPGSLTEYTADRAARDGFEALAALDTGRGSPSSTGYQDGVFDARDAAFGDVRLWQDLNQDGISQAGELSKLVDRGIASIYLRPNSTAVDLGNGNATTGTATVIRSDGSTTQVDGVQLSAGNLALADNPFYRQFPDQVPLTAAARTLPEMGASGWVRDLREAMSIQSAEAQGFTTSVAGFAAAATRDQQVAGLDALITQWAMTTGKVSFNSVRAISTVTLSETATTKTVRVRTVPGDPGLPLGAVYAAAELRLAGTNGPPSAETMRRLGVLEAFNGATFIDFSAIETKSTGGYNQSSGAGGGGSSSAAWGPMVAYIVELAPSQVDLINKAYDELSESVYSGLVVQTRLRAYLDAVDLTIDADGVRFDTTALAARLDAAKAADARNAALDLLELNQYAQATLQAVGFDGLGKLRTWVDALAPGDALRSELQTDRLFAGSTVAGTNRSDVFLGDASANTFDGGAGNDALDGAGGDDTLSAGDGDDFLRGGAGADVLRGGSGDDVLDGGAGNDVMAGGEWNTFHGFYNGAGNDTYLFGRGDGQDRISDFDQTVDALDTLVFKAGVRPEDVIVSRVEEHLVLSIAGTTDSIRVDGFFGADATDGWQVEEVRFTDSPSIVWTVADIKSKALTGGAGNDTLIGYESADVLAGGAGSDILSGHGGDDSLLGSEGNDTLNGDAGNDRLDGGAGDDRLQGGSGDDVLEGGQGNDLMAGGVYDPFNGVYDGTGNDTYRFGRGDGQDRIIDRDLTPGNADTLVFKTGVAPGDVQLSRVGDALLLRIAGSPDQVQIESYFGADGTNGWQIETIAFEDAPGVSWGVADVKLKVLLDGSPNADDIVGYATDDTLSGNDGSDILSGRGGNDALYGGAGNDTLNGDAGNDVLRGEADNDALNGGDGNDILDGGTGNDVLAGGVYDPFNGYYYGWGNDTYRFGRGDGQDRIIDADSTPGNVDQIVFKAGVSSADVQIGRSETALLLSIKGTTDQIRVDGFFGADATDGWQIEEIRFTDEPGTIWSLADVKAKALTGTAAGDVLIGYATADAMYGLDGSDDLSGRAGDDRLDGGAGSDTLRGETGNDTLLGGADNDVLQGGDGADVLDGGSGNDTLAGGVYDTWNGYYNGWGNDSYRFGRGDGQDRIIDFDTTAGNQDTVFFKAGIAPGDVRVSRIDDSLFLTIAGGPDQIRVDGFFGGDGTNGWQVEKIVFEDAPNVTWNIADVKAMALTGSANSDTLIGYATADTLLGNEANDTLYGRGGDDILDGGIGSDNLQGEDGNDILIGGADADVLAGGAGDDVLDGGAGNDLLGGGAMDTWNGNYNGSGNDTYWFGKGDGIDFIRDFDGTVGNFDQLRLKAGVAVSDVTLARAGNALQIRVSSADLIQIDSYFDGQTLGQGYVELIRFDDGTAWDGTTVQGLLGGATLNGTTGIDSLSGSVGDDRINGLAGADTLVGNAGNDLLDGGAGNDAMTGGTGNDTFIVDSTSDVTTESSNQGTDTVRSSVTWTLAANTENLFLTGASAINGTGNAVANWLYGNSGANTLDGKAGSDVMIGGAGDDTYVVDVASDIVIEDLSAGTDLVSAAVSWTLGKNLENLTLTGTTAINGTGNELANVINGNSAANALFGGAGDDVLNGAAGSDAMAGGAGNDTYVVDVTTDVVTENANEGTDLVKSAVTWVLGANLENLTLTGTAAVNATGNGLDNVLLGNSANNTLTGGAGNDTLDGGAGNDTMVGGAGNDAYFVNVSTDVVTELANEGTDTVNSAVTWTLAATLENLTLTGTSAINGTGNALANVLIGNAGKNVLAGAEGDDTYDGAAGADTFTDTSTTSNDTYRWGIGSGLDVLTDSGGSLDHVDLFAGVAKSQLRFAKNGNNLDLTISGQTDKLTINSWFVGSANKIEEFRLSDGSKVLASEVQSLIGAMATFGAPASADTSSRMTAQPVRLTPDLLASALM